MPGCVGLGSIVLPYLGTLTIFILILIETLYRTDQLPHISLLVLLPSSHRGC